MMGLVFVLLLGVYVLVSIGVVKGAIAYARKEGKSARRWGWGAALVMYLIPFWDWIPTVAMHRYYCATEAGFWVYKTPEQWMKENPGMMETLVANKGEPSARSGDMKNYTDTYFANQRFNLIVMHSGQHLINTWRHERDVIDTKTHEVLARYVDFSTSQQQPQAGWSGWKLWLASENCVDGRDHLIRFGEFYLQFKGAGK
jgi:hypothetical protein